MRYPEVESSTLSHPIPEITISTIIRCIMLIVVVLCYPLNFLNAMVVQNMVHSLLSTVICLCIYTLIHQFLQTTHNLKLHDIVNTLESCRVIMWMVSYLSNQLVSLLLWNRYIEILNCSHVSIIMV